MRRPRFDTMKQTCNVCGGDTAKSTDKDGNERWYRDKERGIGFLCKVCYNKRYKLRRVSTVSKYKCPNCGAENYTLESKRYFTDIWDGPHGPPIGYEDHGTEVLLRCNECKEELEPRIDDMDRLFSYRKGIVFY